MTETLTSLKTEYDRDGFCSVDRLADDATIGQLREAYDRVLAYDFEHNRMLGGITHQVMVPSMVDAVFDQNAALDRAREIASELLGVPEVHRIFDMLIFKPAGHPHPTPWHQDASYLRMPTAPAGFVCPQDTVQFWIAIDDADVTNGCMHFVPGVHLAPLIEHEVASGDPTSNERLLAITYPERDLDLSTAVAVPLGAGGATVHGYGTPHYTPPNTSIDRPRRAYIVNFGVKSTF